uniref:Heat shock protein 70 n=1 Tax=Panagrolaimus davidi TaxID=227884 RepID=A0A914QS46_9BILA
MSNKTGIFAGIDLGNENSCIAIYKYEKTEVLAGADGSRITPSYVYIGENGEKHVGKGAKNYGHKKPERLFYDIKRHLTMRSEGSSYKKTQWSIIDEAERKFGYFDYYIDGKFYTPVMILAEIMKKLLSYVGEDVEGVVLTVPAFFSTEQKNKILKAAEMAGITVLQLICEPTAAAIAYGMEHSYTNGEVLFVFDIGDGSFDISIIKVVNKTDFEVIVHGGDSHLGGRDFDGVIIDWMLKKLEEKVGKNNLKKLVPRKKYKIMEMAKEAKEALSQAEDAVIQLSEIHSDADDVTITRTKFEDLFVKLKERIIECIENTLKCKALNQHEIKHVLFVGGSSKIPLIKNLLKEFFNEAKFSKTVNAEEIVALGATRLAAKLGKQYTRSTVNEEANIEKPSAAVEEKINAAGIDFGNSTCFAARNNDNEAITLGNNNEKGLLSYVSYDERQAKCGKVVMRRMLEHSRSTIYDIKKIIGKDIESIEIDDQWPFKIIKTDTSVSIEIESFNGQILKDPEEAMAVILKYVKETMYYDKNFKEMVFSYPFNFNEREKEALKTAAAIAGFEDVTLLPDPISAFYAYYMNGPNFNNQTLLVFDLGGSSLELCVLKVNDKKIDILQTCSSLNVGGKYFDTVLENYLKEFLKLKEKTEPYNLNIEKKQHRLKVDSTTIKEIFEYDTEYEYSFDNVVTASEEKIPITREKFENLSRDLLLEIQNTVNRTKHWKIDKVLQVGGGCRMSMIKRLLQTEFPNAQHLCHEFPEEVVAIGAAFYANNLLNATKYEMTIPQHNA